MSEIPGRTITANTHSVSPISARLLRRQLKHTSRVSLLIVLFASAVSPQTPETNQVPDTAVFRLQVWGYIVADFSERISRYSELRTALEKGSPPLRVTDDPAEIRNAQRHLARKIRAARQGAKQGEFFTPAISVEFKKVLTLEMDDATLAAIMDENPGAFSHQINGTYPSGKTFSTVPPNILASLPRLPDDLQYRFVGRHLILLDTRANLILDRMPCAIQCRD